MTGGDDVVANALVVELEQGFVIHRDVAAARFMLQLFDFRPQLQVFPEEGMPRLPVASTSAWRINSSRHSAGSIWL